MKPSKNQMKRSNRRDFIKKSTLAVSALGAMSTGVFANNINPLQEKEANSEDLKLNLAGYPVNRVKAIINNKVKIKGCTVNFTKAAIGDINTNILNGPQTYDVTEIGLHPFMLAYANDNFRDYTLLPIFPLRIFRQKSVFIRNDRGIKSPEDLRGKTIGTAGYSSTSLTVEVVEIERESYAKKIICKK